VLTLSEVEQIIQSNDAVMLYFSGANCGVCKVLHPKIEKAFSQYYPLIKQIKIDVEQYPQIAGQFGVFALPTIVIYFDGKEFNRKSRNISVDGLLSEIKRPYELFF